MYLKHYCLREAPFGITPDPTFLFLSPSHREALASLLYGIEKRLGFVVVTGEVGVGKTTVLRAVMDKSDPARVKTVYLFNPDVSFEHLLRSMLMELGLPWPGPDVDLGVRALHRFLIEEYRQNHHVVVFVDEAQHIPLNTLERLRVLSNLETRKDKLLQIVLCGQPEFSETLNRHELRQLRQRVAVWAELTPLSREDSAAYIDHRLHRVQYGRTPVFEPEAKACLVRCAAGNPRALNVLCESALVAGYARNEKPVTAKTAREVVADWHRRGRGSADRNAITRSWNLFRRFAFRRRAEVHREA